MKIAFLFTTLFALIATTPHTQAEPLWQGKGRIVISSDGNEHDDDDWAATPMTLAIIAKMGLQKRVPLYTYSDHVWGSNHSFPNRFGHSAYEQMKLSAEGSREWFGYKKSEFICAVDNPEAAYDAMAREINRSTAKSPLFILAAGPMQVVGEGLNRSDRERHKYVTIISHSEWNNKHGKEHGGWTWVDMQSQFDGVNYVMIANQNGREGYPGLHNPREEYDWVKSGEGLDQWFSAEAIDYLYTRIEACQKKKFTYFDVSDSGMALFLFTGDDKSSTAKLRKFFESR